MKPLEVWTCQRAENLKKKLSKIPKNNYAATMVSAACRQIICDGAPINKSRRRWRPQMVSAARRGRRTALLGNRNNVMNAVSKHGASLRKRMGGFRFLLNPDLLRLANKINYDHGRGP